MKALKVIFCIVLLIINILPLFLLYSYIKNVNRNEVIKNVKCYDIIMDICKNSEICEFGVYNDTSEIIIYSSLITEPIEFMCIDNNKDYIIRNTNFPMFL